jgi:pimeloyl-ACP methyl ester carboxylesterase
MANIVLIPGAWLGGGVWGPVQERLRAEQGHTVCALTLPGLAERTGRDAAQVTLADHVADVLSVLDAGNLRDVVLVGHSYAGLVAGQAAAAAAGRVAHLVFLDANVPTAGASMVDGWSAAGARMVSGQIAANGGLWGKPEAADFAGEGMTDEQIQRLLAGASDHPGRTVLDPAVLDRPLTDMRVTYIKCTLRGAGLDPSVAAFESAPSWDFVELDAGHWPMFSRPEQLAALLGEVAAKG